MSLIKSFEHALAIAAQDIVKTAKFIVSEVEPALKAVAATETTVEAITALVDPQAVNIERTAYALLGKAIAAIDRASMTTVVTEDDGIVKGIILDPQTIADLLAITASIKAKAAPSMASITAQ